MKRNFPPAPHCPSARIHSSASILKTSNSPKPASNSLEFPSNSPSNSPSPTRKMLSPWGPRMLPSVCLQDMWSAFFVHFKKSWFESHNYSDKGAQARDTFTCAARKENGTSYIDLASQQAYSPVQSSASGHVHEVVHTLRHLLAEAIDIVVIVHPCRCSFAAPLVVIH